MEVEMDYKLAWGAFGGNSSALKPDRGGGCSTPRSAKYHWSLHLQHIFHWQLNRPSNCKICICVILNWIRKICRRSVFKFLFYHTHRLFPSCYFPTYSSLSRSKGKPRKWGIQKQCWTCINVFAPWGPWVSQVIQNQPEEGIISVCPHTSLSQLSPPAFMKGF